jgi:uncharacterized Zn finger protein
MARRRYDSFPEWRSYVPATARQGNAALAAFHLKRQGVELQPVQLETRKIAASFWGKAWCDNLERYGDYENRLPRGRTYVRNGSVIDLRIGAGTIDALVSGSEVYTVAVKIAPLPPRSWRALIAECSGRIGSLLDLLQGRFSTAVMELLARAEGGLFPVPKQIEFSCSCPDWAAMCKHVAAVLYGVGARFDAQPELFFTLRQVDSKDLISAAAGAEGLAVTAPRGSAPELADADLSGIFGIELEPHDVVPRRGARPKPAAPARRSAAKKAKAKVAPPRRRVRARSEDDGFGEVFGPGREVSSALLVGFGVPRTTFTNWIHTRVLVRTPTRGVYRTTANTLERVRRALARSVRKG